MNAVIESHRHDLEKEPTYTQVSKMQEDLKMIRTELKRRDLVLPTSSHLRRDERTFGTSKGKNLKKSSPGRKVLGQNLHDNKDTMKKQKRKTKNKGSIAEKGIPPPQNSKPAPQPAGNEGDAIVYYRKKKLLTPPPHEINYIEEFIPAKRKKKQKDGSSEDTNTSIKYIYEKKRKKKSKVVVANSVDGVVAKPAKLKKNKRDLDLAFQMQSIPEEEPILKKKIPEEEPILKKKRNPKEEIDKEKKLSGNKVEEKSTHKKTCETAKDLNKKSPHRHTLIEDFVAQINLNQSLTSEPEKKRNSEQTNRNCTIQNHESTQILEMENKIADLSKSNNKRTLNGKKINKSLSEKTYHELDVLMDKWFKHDLKNIGENNDGKGSSMLGKKRRKSLELPREKAGLIDKKKRLSVNNPVTTAWVVGSNHVDPNVAKKGQVRKMVEEKSSPKKLIERTNVGDNQDGINFKSPTEKAQSSKKPNAGKTAGETSSPDKQLNKDKIKESEESLYKLIQELKEQLGLQELFRILKKHWIIKRSFKDTTENVDEIIQASPAKNNQNDVENNLTGPSLDRTPKSHKNKSDVNEGVRKLIETTALSTRTAATQEKNDVPKGNLEADLHNNDVKGLIYSPETLIQADINEPLMINTEDVDHQWDIYSSDSWNSVPVHIKHSPISIKDEHFSNIDSDGNHLEHKLENDVEVDETQREPDIVENNVTLVNGGELPSQSNEEEIDDVQAAIEDEGKYDFVDLQELNPRQKRVLMDLEVNLPFEPPLSHTIETRMSCFPTQEQIKEFKHLGLKIKKGRFNLEEDSLIRRNWLDFIKEHDIPNDPVPFLYFIHPFSNTEALLSQSNKNKFVQYLGRDLDNRLLYSIHRRFKILFTKLKKGRFTVEEDRIIIYLMEEYKNSHKAFSQIAYKLNRTRFAVQRHWEQLESEAKLGVVTKVVSNETILIAIMKTLKCERVEELKNKTLSFETYKELGDKVNMIPNNVRLRWLTTIYPALFSKIRDMNEVKRRFINLLVENKVDDVRNVKFAHYAKKYFDGCTGNVLSRMLRVVMQQIPDEEDLNFRDALLYLQKNVIGFLPEVLFATIDVPNSEF